MVLSIEARVVALHVNESAQGHLKSGQYISSLGERTGSASVKTVNDRQSVPAGLQTGRVGAERQSKV